MAGEVAGLEPAGWEPPESLTAAQVLRLAAGESGADVAPMSERRKSAPGAALVEALRSVLDQHVLWSYGRCGCGIEFHRRGKYSADHRAHLAAVVAAEIA